MGGPQDNSDNISTDSMPNYNHQCYICDKTFSANSNLNRHLRKIHKENVLSPYNNVKCALCDLVFSSSSIYIRHLDELHSVKVEIEHHKFTDKEAFEDWKHSVENESTSQYIKSRGEKRSKSVNKTYYSCNRSGYYMSKARTRKALKKQGSRKINGRCPASMNVTLNTDQTYDVRFVKTHVGHDFELKHLDISDKDRNLIVQKLVSGLTKREIIKQIRSNIETSDQQPKSPTDLNNPENSNVNLVKAEVTNLSSQETVYFCPDSQLVNRHGAHSTPLSSPEASSSNSCVNISNKVASSRLHLATTKDIHNIINSKNLDSKLIRHNYDVSILEAWISDIQELDEISSVPLYKPQSQLNARFPKLSEDDFALAIMKDGQSNFLKKFAHKCVIIDSTHHVQCEYLQVTLLAVIDDNDKCLPVAWLFSSKTNLDVMEAFFTVIRDRVGSIATRMVIADELNAFYQAWTNIMTRPTHNLLTPWSVFDAWSKRFELISNREKLRKIKKTLRVLLIEPCEDKFKSSLDLFIGENRDDPEVAEFVKYFEENHSRDPDIWSNCLRESLGVSNSQLWKLHDKFKVVYKDGKNSKRLCSYVINLMNIFDPEQLKMISDVEDKNPGKKKGLLNRHLKSVKAETLVYEVAVEPACWLFPSDGSTETFFEVKQSKKESKCCDLMCPTCSTCRHDYKCTCLDYVVNLNMCKHIHRVCLMRTE